MIVLLPVCLGMLVRGFKPGFARAMDKPVRLASVVILTLVIAGAVVSNFAVLKDDFIALAGIVVSFCILSLAIGFIVPRLFRINREQSIASAFEVGLHNATLAIVIAESVLAVPDMSLPAAVYGVLMFPLAAVFGLLIARKGAFRTAPAEG